MADLKERAAALEGMLAAAGIEKYALGVSEGEMRELNTEGANFNLYRTIFSNGASVVAFIGGKKGSASGNDLSDEALRQLVEDARAAAESAEPDDANDIAPFEEPEVFRCGPLEPDMDGLYRRMDEMLSAIEREYPRVLVMQAIGSHSSSHSLYVNSNGTRFESFDGSYDATVEFAGNDGSRSTGLSGASVSMHDLDTPILDLGLLRKKLADAEASLQTVEIGDKFVGTVILDPEGAAQFASTLVDNFMSGRVIVDGTSMWLDKVGEKVADESITLRLQCDDDRLVARAPYTGDGFRAKNVALIEDGVLKCHVLDLYSANKTGRPVTRGAGGFVLEPGSAPVADLVAGVKRGLLVGWFSGGQPGANGEFSGVAKGSFYVEDGEVKGAVMETMISGNLVDAFSNVVGVSSELVSDGTCAFPYLAIDGVTISGN